MGPWCEALASLKRSELWAPSLKVVYNGGIKGLSGFRIRGPYEDSMRPTSELRGSNGA